MVKPEGEASCYLKLLFGFFLPSIAINLSFGKVFTVSGEIKQYMELEYLHRGWLLANLPPQGNVTWLLQIPRPFLCHLYVA